ncbi:hypothetical protein GOBAR_AA33451 [Gossypium barbadense]|uniref:RING-type domain-containing protein n=1 Tax=Gossypium barbadense TaxID=3634 RepID=A0A2P5W821_GOSBA|nr:hypothetical protein GOBAR_AA33451 [Gossypium barbadense]
MAVEARNMNLFPPQLIPNGDFMKGNQGSGNIHNTQMQQEVSQIFPAVYQPLVRDPISAKADSGVTYNMNIPVSAPRKRPRDSYSYIVARKNDFCGTEKVRLEVEERRKRQSRMLITAIQEGVMKKLKEKDEEIQRMGKLNWVLQERVKSLYLENQLWRDLAQTNEATANSLRTNLEQVLAHVGEERHASGGGAAALADDAESSCGSSDEGWRKVVLRPTQPHDTTAAVVGNGNNNGRKCRKCGEKESSVLLLPCRHLCLCTMCGSTLVGTCPVCDSVTNASVHVNMS